MITLITPTRHRGQHFAQLEKYVERARQHYAEDVQWIVVCDGGAEDYEFTQDQDVIVRQSQGPLHSINQNYLAALERIKFSKIIPIEDDDWFAADWFSVLADKLDEADLVGAVPAHYYHVGARKYRSLKNHHWASLACTAFTSQAIPAFKRCAENHYSAPWIDMLIYSWFPDILGGSLQLFPNPENRPLHVGLKGLDGHGVGQGHDATRGTPDPDGIQLRAWIGADADYYRA